MATSSKNYPKAIPFHAPDELTRQNAQLKQLNEELTAQVKRLAQANEELACRAARLRLWTLRLAGVCAALVLVPAAAVGIAVIYPETLFGSSRASGPFASVGASTETRDVPPPIVVPKVAPTELPVQAIAKPDAVSSQRTGYLEALGSLSATHLYQTHLNIGLLADGVESETYSVQEAERHLKTVMEMAKLADSRLDAIARSGLDAEDRESIRQIQAVTGLLHAQADAVRAYWATNDAAQAERFHKARKAAWQNLSKVMGME